MRLLKQRYAFRTILVQGKYCKEQCGNTCAARYCKRLISATGADTAPLKSLLGKEVEARKLCNRGVGGCRGQFGLQEQREAQGGPQVCVDSLQRVCWHVDLRDLGIEQRESWGRLHSQHDILDVAQPCPVRNLRGAACRGPLAHCRGPLKQLLRCCVAAHWQRRARQQRPRLRRMPRQAGSPLRCRTPPLRPTAQAYRQVCWQRGGARRARQLHRSCRRATLQQTARAGCTTPRCCCPPSARAVLRGQTRAHHEATRHVQALPRPPLKIKCHLRRSPRQRSLRLTPR